MTDNAIILLQEKIAYQEEEIHGLSDEIYRQQKEIRALQSQMARLEAQMLARPEENDQPAGREPPPPHY